jgi:hypothetical protein
MPGTTIPGGYRKFQRLSDCNIAVCCQTPETDTLSRKPDRGAPPPAHEVDIVYRGGAEFAERTGIMEPLGTPCLEVAISSGSTLRGVVLANQVKSLDCRVQKAEFICKLPRETTNDVLDKLGTLSRDET